MKATSDCQKIEWKRERQTSLRAVQLSWRSLAAATMRERRTSKWRSARSLATCCVNECKLKHTIHNAIWLGDMKWRDRSRFAGLEQDNPYRAFGSHKAEHFCNYTISTASRAAEMLQPSWQTKLVGTVLCTLSFLLATCRLQLLQLQLTDKWWSHLHNHYNQKVSQF